MASARRVRARALVTELLRLLAFIPPTVGPPPMEEATYLELYLDQCAAQDELAPPRSPLLSPVTSYDMYLPNPSIPKMAFSSHLEVKETSGDFSSVDLSFLPDELTQENKDETVIGSKDEMEKTCKTQCHQRRLPLPNEQDIDLHLHGTSLSSSQSHLYPDDPDSVQPSPEKPTSDPLPLASITPMKPITPVSECSGIVPQLQNIVSTVNLSCKLDLKKIALHAKNAEYNPKRFAAVIMRIREPRTTALIFSSGKMVCTGAKSEEQSRLAARKYARVVQKLGFPARFLDFKIQNMVGSCDVRFPIRLEGLVLTHQQFSSYEPELFPGLIYRMVKPRIVLLIFVSGKVVLTGTRFFFGRFFSPELKTQVRNLGCKPGEEAPGGLLLALPLELEPEMVVECHVEFWGIPCGRVRQAKARHSAVMFWKQSPNKGAKERSEIYEAFENIYPILKGFKKA